MYPRRAHDEHPDVLILLARSSAALAARIARPPPSRASRLRHRSRADRALVPRARAAQRARRRAHRSRSRRFPLGRLARASRVAVSRRASFFARRRMILSETRALEPRTRGSFARRRSTVRGSPASRAIDGIVVENDGATARRARRPTADDGARRADARWSFEAARRARRRCARARRRERRRE